MEGSQSSAWPAGPPASSGSSRILWVCAISRYGKFVKMAEIPELDASLAKNLSSYICYIVCVSCIVLFTHFSAVPYSTDLARYVRCVLLVSSGILFMLP